MGTSICLGVVGTVLTVGALYLFLKIALPLLAIAAIAYFAYRMASRERHPTFTSSEPTPRDTTEEYRMELEDIHKPDDHPPRV
jgi:hypothetical protein